MVGVLHRPFDSRSWRHVLALTRSLCPHLVFLVGFGANLGPAALAQTGSEILQKSPASLSANPPANGLAASLRGNSSATITTPALSPEVLGDVYLARQKYQAAIAAYSKAPQMTAAMWDKTGVAYQMLLDDQDAIRCYQQASRLAPSYAEPLNNLGTIYETHGHYAEAEREYRAALNLNPGSARMHRNLGTVLMVEGKYTQGWKAYQEAIAIDPDIFVKLNGPQIGNAATKQGHGAVYYYTALADLRVGNMSAAIDNLRVAMNEGFVTLKKISTDKNLATLRDNPAFRQLLADEGLH